MLVSGHPVGVTCVHPGGIKTGISRNGRKTASQDAAALDSLFEKKLARMTPEKAAKIILNGALSGKARVLVGADAHAAAPLRQARRLALPGHRRQAVHARSCAAPQELTPASYESVAMAPVRMTSARQARSEGSALPPQTMTQTRSPRPGT